MRLVEIVAEHYYMKDCDGRPWTSLLGQDSNVRDYYFGIAYREIPALISSYISQHGWLGKLVRGCIRSFINAHGVTLDRSNCESLAKRIVREIQASKGKGNSEKKETAAILKGEVR